MERGTRLCFLLLLSLAPLMIGPAQGYDFQVGGRSGWVTSPSESYSSWSGRMRFSVNDSLVFVYDNSIDSVLEVTSSDYSSCNAASPITKLNSGRDSFKLPRSGPFYFISGNASHCQAGQKVIVVVLAIRSPPSSPTPPGPGSSPSATAPAPSGTTPPTAPAPASSISPAPAPASSISPATAPAPASTSPTPASAPSSAPSLAPASSPSSAPALAPSSGSSPSPPTGGSGSAPSSGSAPGSTTSPGSSGSGSAGSPPAPPGGSTATILSVPASFSAILIAATLALFGGAILQ